jgi:hypothetical protein
VNFRFHLGPLSFALITQLSPRWRNWVIGWCFWRRIRPVSAEGHGTAVGIPVRLGAQLLLAVLALALLAGRQSAVLNSPLGYFLRGARQ